MGSTLEIVSRYLNVTHEMQFRVRPRTSACFARMPCP